MTDPPDGTTYDVFLSHNSADKPAVLDLAERLKAAGVSPFLDAWHLVPGEPWQEALEEAILASRTCAVFVGPAGFGTWENEEMRAALSRRAHNDEFRVIPVILPGAVLPAKGRLPPFLSRLTWVDFRPGLDDAAAFDRLVNGIRGLAPAEDGEEDRDDASIVCPFRGLEVFDEEHAQYFFGREALTQYLVEQLRDDRFLAVLGPSGSGKSSVVRAGLIPQVRAGALPGSAEWRVAIVKPGPHPMEALASRLAGELTPAADALAARETILANLRENERGLHAVVQTALGESGVDARLVVVVDQFEEIFTLCHDDAERAAFVDALLYASSLVGGQTVVVITMRADFFGKCATMPVLAARLADRDVLVPPMDHDELRRAMLLPAEKAGLQFEKGLVDTILDDLGDEPGSLPLLQHTLFELFEGRRERWLTIDHYHEIGGVQGAIAQRAETVYAHLTPEQQITARRVLLRLTEPGEGTEDTRRRAPVTELLPAGASPDAVEAVVNQLADARLLVTSENDTGDEVVDVAHEALIRGWPRLQAWIGENPLALRIHRRITETATEWSAATRDPSYLFGGQRLDEALRWSSDNDGDLNDLEREFLEASKSARLKDAASRRRRTRLAIGGAAVSIVLITSAVVVAIIKVSEAVDATEGQAGLLLVSEARRLASNEPLLSLRMEVEGLAKLANSDAAPLVRELVIDQLESGRTDVLRGVSNAWVSQDGRFVVVLSDSESGLWNLENRSLVTSLPSTVCDVSFPAGEETGIAEIEYSDQCDGDQPVISYELLRLSNGEKLTSSDGKILDDDGDPAARAVAASIGGESQLLSLTTGDLLGKAAKVDVLHGVDRAVLQERDGTTRLVDTTQGSLVAELGVLGRVIPGQPNSSAFGTQVKGKECLIWTAHDGSPVATVPSCTRLQLSRDGSVGAAWSPKGVELFDVVHRRHLVTLGPDVWHIEFSPAGPPTTFLAMSKVGPIRLLRTEGGAPIGSFDPSLIVTAEDVADQSAAFAYSPDGRFVFVRAGENEQLPFDDRATLRSTSTGEPIELTAPFDADGAEIPLFDVTFSTTDSTYIEALFSGNVRRIYRSADGSIVTFGSDSDVIALMAPPVGLIFVEQGSGVVEVWKWDRSIKVDEFPVAWIAEFTLSPHADPPLVVVTWDELQADEARRPVLIDASGRATRLNGIDRPVISPDSGASWFVNEATLWARREPPVHLAALPVSAYDFHFDPTGRRLFVGDYPNLTAYFIDIPWLESIADKKPRAMSDETLVDFVCSGPAGTLVDPVALAKAMGDTEPSACN